MGIKQTGRVIISFIVAFILILPVISHAQQKDRIKVVVRNASVRLQPNVDSEVILSPPIGSTFEVEKKVGEWFEIKFSSEIGVLITGYIHSMFVEVMAAEPEPEPEPEVMRKPVRKQPQPKPRRTPRPPAAKSKFNITLGGFYSAATETFTNSYSVPSWGGEDLYVDDYLKSPNAGGMIAGVGVFLMPRIELFGNVATSTGTPWWELALSVPSPYFFDDYRSDFADTDTLSEPPIFRRNVISFGLNLYLMRSDRWNLYIGGGGSYVLATVDLVYNVTYTQNLYPLTSDHDVTIDSVTFEESEINAFGFNIRGGGDFRIGKNIYLFAEGIYIMAKAEPEYPLDTDVILEFDLGGMSSAFGIKIYF